MKGKIIFDGEYLNGKIWKGIENKYNMDYYLLVNAWIRKGKRKEYFDNNKIKLKSEYLNKKRNIKGKEYNYDWNIIFEGEYINRVQI